MKEYTIEEKHILIFALNHSIPDGEHSRQILTDPNTGYLVELCCILFIVVMRWFTSTLSNQEPLKINSASTISIIPLRRDFGYCKLH
jgi:hypothetical protein